MTTIAYKGHYIHSYFSVYDANKELFTVQIVYSNGGSLHVPTRTLIGAKRRISEQVAKGYGTPDVRTLHEAMSKAGVPQRPI